MSSLLGRHFWLPAYLALALGLLLPGDDWSAIAPLVPVMLGGILFFACLRIPWASVVAAVGDRARWGRVGWLAALKLVGLPLAAWALVRVVAPDWAPGMLLVALMPAGLTSVAMAGMLGGDALMALLLVVATSLLCPLTIPGLLALLADGAPDPGLVAGRAVYILVLLGVPFAAAQAARRWLPGLVERHAGRWGPASIACSLVLILVSVLSARGSWRGSAWTGFLPPLALGTLVIALAGATSWWLSRILPRAEVAAFACGALWLNNGLAVAFATRFFPGDPHMLLPAVAIQVPIIAAVVVLGEVQRRAVPAAEAAGT